MSAPACRATQFSADHPPRHSPGREGFSRWVFGVQKHDAILIIDDEPSVADALRLILGDEGYPVLVAANGCDGLELARREEVRLVITDLRLPDISGLEVLCALRRERPDVAVILISSHGTPELFARAERDGAAAVLSKPFAPSDIIRLVDQIM